MLKKEWGKLKDNYRKTLSKRDKATRSGAGNKKLPTCNFFAELSFLHDSVSNRLCTTNIPSALLSPTPSPSLSVVVDDEISDDSSFASPPYKYMSSSGSESRSAHTESKKRRPSNNDETDMLLIQTLDKHLSSVPPNQLSIAEEDDDRLFSLSLVKTLKGLDAKKKGLAKIKIQQVLFDIQFQD